MTSTVFYLVGALATLAAASIFLVHPKSDSPFWLLGLACACFLGSVLI